MAGRKDMAQEGALDGALVRPAVLDGVQALELVLERAGYQSVAHAVAEHAIFLHPTTVAQTRGEPVFAVVRARLNRPRGNIVTLTDGRRVWADDNTPPTCAFLWAAGRRKGPDVQFNHVWSGSESPELYTALWNLVATPAFLAKTTDTHPDVRALLQYHAYALYGRLPRAASRPAKPPVYDKLKWAPMPGPVPDLEATYRAAMKSCPKNRTTVSARELGWLFSRWNPDSSL